MSDIQILKTESCPSLSGLSTLTYQIGCSDDCQIHIRLDSNSGSGIFCKDWTLLNTVEQLLSGDKPITSGLLHALFKGKSSNSAGFLLAVLKHEGVIKLVDEKLRRYELCDLTEFKRGIQAMIKPSSTAKSKPAKDDN